MKNQWRRKTTWRQEYAIQQLPSLQSEDESFYTVLFEAAHTPRPHDALAFIPTYLWVAGKFPHALLFQMITFTSLNEHTQNGSCERQSSASKKWFGPLLISFMFGSQIR